MAGIVFINKKPDLEKSENFYGINRKGEYTSLGGSIKKKENIYHAMVREVIEELYGFYNKIPSELIEMIISNLHLRFKKIRITVLPSSNYSWKYVICSFEELEKLLYIVYSYITKNPKYSYFYTRFGKSLPLTISEIVNKTNKPKSRFEIQRFGITTFQAIKSNPSVFSKHSLFVQDVNAIIRQLKSYDLSRIFKHLSSSN